MARKDENPITFNVGIRKNDPKTNEYIGLDQRAEDADVLGKDVKEVIKDSNLKNSWWHNCIN